MKYKAEKRREKDVESANCPAFVDNSVVPFMSTVHARADITEEYVEKPREKRKEFQKHDVFLRNDSLRFPRPMLITTET